MWKVVSSRHPEPPASFRAMYRVWDAICRISWQSAKAAGELRTAERFGAMRPRCARQHLHLASAAIRRADFQREIACKKILAASKPGSYKLVQEWLIAQAVWSASERGKDAVAWLEEVRERLNELLAILGSPDADDARRRRFLAPEPISAADRILDLFKRRQRWKTAAPEDAPRRVSRGRAPPLLADCTL